MNNKHTDKGQNIAAASAEDTMIDGNKKPEEISDEALDAVTGGNNPALAAGITGGGIPSGGSRGGGGGGGGFAAQASFQPFHTEPGEELPDGMSTDPIQRK